MAQILVVKSKSLTAPDKKVLREAGVVVVEASDPASVRLLGVEPAPMDCNDMLYAAIQAIAGDKYSNNTCDAFAKQMAALAKANRSQE